MATVNGHNCQTGALPATDGHRPTHHPHPDLAAHHQRDASRIAEHGQPPLDTMPEAEARMLARSASDGPEGIGRGRYRTVHRELDPLARNERVAHANRAWLAHRGVLLVHLVGSPRTGKTALIEALVTAPGKVASVSALEGGRATALDTERLNRAGCRALRLNTSSGFHLDAMTVARGLLQLNPPWGSTVVVESMGDPASPGWFDLGEHAKVVVMSVTEGEDTPLKYPETFRSADLFVMNKIDLLPYVEFDLECCISRARSSKPDLPIVCLSARTGEGLDAFASWLRSAREGSSAAPATRGGTARQREPEGVVWVDSMRAPR
jgi:hydrogenase nickel incorporation protein HypB